jgi:hypothetical protein
MVKQSISPGEPKGRRDKEINSPYPGHTKLKTVKGNAGSDSHRDVKVLSEVIRANT